MLNIDNAVTSSDVLDLEVISEIDKAAQRIGKIKSENQDQRSY
jgi:hypothetical protein